VQYGQLRGVNKPISRLVQGTGFVGSGHPGGPDYWFRHLDAVLEAGCTAFDTAHIYGAGDNERTFGRWVRSRNIRDRIVIIGKGAHFNDDRDRVTPFDIASDLHDTLARLKTDYVDLYLLHRDDPGVPVGPLVEALNEHLRAGKIRAFGGSNWTHQRIEEANQYARARGLRPFVASSPHFSLAEIVDYDYPGVVSISGPSGAQAREWYARCRMTILPWSSLSAGFLSGRIRAKGSVPASHATADRLFGSSVNYARLERARQLGRRRGLTVPQVSLAYLVSQEVDVCPIVGAKRVAHFLENVAALEVRLSAPEVAWLESGDGAG
jgi:aryl-alcohol dehydrogenase-like predicted oxidoreductase